MYYSSDFSLSAAMSRTTHTCCDYHTALQRHA